MEAILRHLIRAYAPVALVVYGSYADGAQDERSDFDALLLTEKAIERHDTGVIGGVQLDVFVYPAEHFRGDYDVREILQIHDGRIILDSEGLAAGMRQRVRDHVARTYLKSPEEIGDSLMWCRKMCARAAREDAEGLYRRHWLLTESLEICCDVLRRPYFGPKKSLRWLEANAPETFRQYAEALKAGSPEALSAWVGHLEAISNLNRQE